MRFIWAVVLAAIATSAYAEDEGEIDFSQLKVRYLKKKINPDRIEIEERIVGGDIVTMNSIPYQAALVVTGPDGAYLCGGVLVSRTHILTAAHCLTAVSQIRAHLGAHYWNSNEGTQQVIFTTQYEVHHGYSPTLFINDIAVVTLPYEVELNDFVQLATLPTFADVGNTFAGELGRVSGWGVISDETQEASPGLKAVEAEIMTNTACNVAFLGIIAPTHICTSGEDGVGGCHGDGGGPLVLGNKLVGIVSFALGLGCETGWPTVYSRVTAFLDWIDDHTDANISRM